MTVLDIAALFDTLNLNCDGYDGRLPNHLVDQREFLSNRCPDLEPPGHRGTVVEERDGLGVVFSENEFTSIRAKAESQFRLKDELPSCKTDRIEITHVLLPNDTMTVLDIAALFDTLNRLDRDGYDGRLPNHMCWWTSANFFRIVVQTWNLQIIEGPLFKERGCVFGLPVVAPDTFEVVLLEDPDYSKMLKGLEMDSCADLTSEEADELVESRVRDIMQEIRQQSEKIQNNPDRHNLALIGIDTREI
ncbi:hypothetical protein FB446DRAFT_769763 [Lentinula raphanica]|nr:hypothetical protein FB446DRAFT_769763 [Lentinula raphanica]